MQQDSKLKNHCKREREKVCVCVCVLLEVNCLLAKLTQSQHTRSVK